MSDIPENDVPVTAVADAAPAVPAKRKRGRPPLSDAEKAARAKTRPAVRKVRESAPRPRVATTPEPSRSTDAPITDEKLKGLLLAMHQIAAIATRTPELALDDAEAATMSEAILRVLTEYDIAISGKAAALIGFAGACAIVYIPRAMLIKDRRQRERGDSARVVDIKRPGDAA